MMLVTFQPNSTTEFIISYAFWLGRYLTYAYMVLPAYTCWELESKLFSGYG